MEYVIVYEKVTTWLRHSVGVENINSRQEALDKVINYYKDPRNAEGVSILDTEEIPETEESMTVEENEGFATIEVVDRSGQVLWDNSNQECKR